MNDLNHDKSSSNARLQCAGLLCGYGSPILPPLEVELHTGEVAAVIGPNGGGKSTFFKTMLGLIPSLGGEISIADGARIAYLEQGAHIDSGLSLSVKDVLRSGLVRSHRLSVFAKQSIDVQSTIEAFELSELMHRAFHHLSGGQRQRVLLAKEFMSRPNLLLLDEPTSAMDPMMAQKTFTLIQSLAESHQCAILMVSHEANVIPNIADKVLFLDAEYNAYEYGTPHSVTSSKAFERRYRFHFHSHDLSTPCDSVEGDAIRLQAARCDHGESHD